MPIESLGSRDGVDHETEPFYEGDMVKVTSGFSGIAVIILVSLAFFSYISAAGAKESTMKKKYFQGSDAEKMLEQAIRQDSAEGIVRAIKAGANPNTRGLYGVNPLKMAAGKFKKQVVAELLRQGADTSVRDVEGDNAVTIVMRAYKANI